jgi:hypothetical protein
MKPATVVTPIENHQLQHPQNSIQPPTQINPEINQNNTHHNTANRNPAFFLPNKQHDQPTGHLSYGDLLTSKQANTVRLY